MSDEPTTRADVPPDRLTALWRRLKDHRIAQWTVGYVAVAYGIQHAVTLTSEAFDWPHVVTRLSMLLLALGLPLAMTFAWYHGERASRRVSAGEMSIVSVMLVGISLIFFLFVRSAPESLPTRAVAEAGVAAARSASLSPGTAISLAVLPLANVSGDKDQEFFSDGMTDAIMSALAKVAGLRVVGRESAFEFKGKSQNDRVIGRALGARYLVEGSVLKVGQRVRITSQLVRAEDGVSLWTENYNRELTDIFAVQDGVARAIVASLQIPLGLKLGESLVPNRTRDTDNYQDYLRARALRRARANDEAIAVLKPLVKRDPNYAPAWALLASATMADTAINLIRHSGSIDEARRLAQDGDAEAEMAAREAIRLDPQYAGGYARLGGLEYLRYKWVAGEDLIKQALALDSSEPETLDFYSLWLATAGRLRESLSLREQLRTLEPFVPAFNINTAAVTLISGQPQAAIHTLEAIPADAAPGIFGRNLFLAKAFAAAGRYREAASTLLLVKADLVSARSVEDAARIIQSAPTKTTSPEALPALPEGLNFVYAYTRALDRVMAIPERDLKVGRPEGFVEVAQLWSPEFAPLRKTERFKAFVLNSGLVEYWRARGWPDLCHPVGSDDFACD